MDPFQPAQLTPEMIEMILARQQLQMPENSAPGMSLPDAGLGPVTPATMAGQPNDMASPFQPTGGQEAGLMARQGLSDMGMPGLGERLSPFVEGALDYGSMPAQGMADQFGRATDAVAGAMADPTLPNIGNAGVQTGATIGNLPIMAGGAALGFGGALADDLGFSATSPAEAAKRRQRPSSAVPDLPGLTPDQQAAYKATAQRADREGWGPKRRQQEMEFYQNLSAQASSSGQRLEEERKRGEQREYDRRVEGAEAARDREMARDRRFSDTSTGKFVNQMGGLAPFAAAAGAGVGHRFAFGPGKGLVGKYAAPFLEGTAAAFGMQNLPDIYNAGYTEPDNPRRRALEEYGRELPDGHPRKQESLDAAAKLDKTNPVRDAATANLTDPKVLGARGIAAAAEGTLAPLAAGIAGGPSRIIREYRGAKAANHRGIAPGAQNAKQRASAAESARAARAEVRGDMGTRSADPATAQWFADNQGLGPVQRLRAFNEAHGTSYNQRQLANLERMTTKTATAASQEQGAQQLTAHIKQQIASGSADAVALRQALAGNNGVRAMAKAREQYIQQFPALADMSAKRINQIIRDAAR